MLGPFETARAVRDAIVSRQISAEEACRAALDRIEATNPRLHAFHSVSADRALARARALDAGPSDRATWRHHCTNSRSNAAG